jgi:dTDP-glucose 4,6-dehydratase
MMKTILVTGGAGFIGCNFINWFLEKNRDFTLINLDKLTYAGNLGNLKSVENLPGYRFIKGDICDARLVYGVMEQYKPEYIVNFAAESHVDRSINNPLVFAETNIIGVATLLDTVYRFWGKTGFDGKCFLQISTDEVYGSIGQEGIPFSEESPLLPNSPYSASKASADLLVRSFVKTYHLPAIITRCCNNYGPCQYTEKFIPTCITNALRNKPIPIYGDGTNIREWIHVLDHCEAITRALFEGRPGDIYNIGSGEESSNIDLAKIILNCLNKPEDLIKMVSDRPGHDFRYALNSAKANKILKWRCKYKFSEGIQETIRWYENY